MRHLDMRLKKVQLADDRKLEIARDNRKLMEKMTESIKGRGKAPISGAPAYRLNRSLNERERGEYVERVNLDNKLMLQRLRSQTAYINVKKMEDDFQRFLDARKVLSKAYKRQSRAKQEETRRKRAQQFSASTHLSSLPSTSMHSASPSDASAGGSAPSFRTARQLRDSMVKEGKGGFVPLPSLVQPPPASSQPSYRYSEQDESVSRVGGQPVQFGIQHTGASVESAPAMESTISSAEAPPEHEEPAAV